VDRQRPRLDLGHGASWGKTRPRAWPPAIRFRLRAGRRGGVRERRDQLTDPRFYDQMSKLLDDLIRQSQADTAAYEKFLRDAEALVKRLAAKQPEAGVPAALHGKREATVIYNNLSRILAAGRAEVAVVAEPRAEYDDSLVRLALEIDRVMRERAPAGWKGDQAREAQVLNALFPLLDRNREATRALFELIKNQPGYG